MMKFNLQNERIKKRYYEWLKESGKGFSISTIDQVSRSVGLWEKYTKMQDFQRLNIETIKAFKKTLREKINTITKRPLSLTTQHHYLIYIKDFYCWLSMQPRYKSKIVLTDTSYFTLDRKQTRMALNQPKKRIPTPEIIKKAVISIRVENEIDRRDQALMIFAFISGMRIDAIISLPLGCIDMDKMLISQDPNQGVRTKFAKDIPTTIFIFDEGLVSIFKEWVRFLKEEKLFTDADPLFPCTKIEQESPDSYCFVANKLERKFWKNANGARNIFKKRFEIAGLEYFTPHSFRHTAVNTALSLCKTPSDFKAVSQNLGHKNIATTMFDYASLPEDEVVKHVKNITSKGLADEGEIIKRLLQDYDIKPKNN